MNEDRRNEIHDKSISDFYVVWWMEKKNVFRRKIVEKTTCVRRYVHLENKLVSFI